MTREVRKIPNRLRKHRRIMGYTQREVAWLLGHKSISRISKWEKGSCMPSVENLLKLSFLYHTLANELYLDLSRELQESLRQKERRIKRDNPPSCNSP